MSFRDRTAIVYLLRDALVVVDADFRETQRIPLPKDAKIVSATVAASFISVEREEASPLLFQDDGSLVIAVSWPEEVSQRI